MIIYNNLRAQRCNQGRYMKKLKKNILLLITALLLVTAAIIWIIDAPSRKTKAFLASYEITDLTALGFRNVRAINDKGQALGTDNQNRTCIWDEQNGLTILNIPQEAGYSATAFNNSGQIAGFFYKPSGEKHVFIWDANNGLIHLGTLGGRNSFVNAMNDSGQVIGHSEDPNGRLHPFFWDPNTGMTDLSLFTNNQDRITHALDIDNAGRVVGSASDGSTTYAIIWDKETGFVRLPTPNDASGVAYNISPDGKVAGCLEDNTNLIIWDSPNNCRVLAALRRNARHRPMNINDAGQIVGWASQRGILSSRSSAFFWSNETGFIVLEELGKSRGKLKLPKLPWLTSSESRFLAALDINNKGQILKVTAPHSGQYPAILMTPKKAPKE